MKLNRCTYIFIAILLCFIVFMLMQYNQVNKVFPERYTYRKSSSKRKDIKLCENLEDLQIFLYDVPEELLYKSTVGNITFTFHENDCNCWPDPGYDTEFVIHQELKARNLLIPHKKPDLYFIPHYSTCLFHKCLFGPDRNKVNCYDLVNRYTQQILSHIYSNYSYFNKSQGTDHIITFPHDSGQNIIFRFSDELRSVLENVISLQNTVYINPAFPTSADPALKNIPKNYVALLPVTPKQEGKFFRDYIESTNITSLPIRKTSLQFRGGVDQHFSSFPIRKILVEKLNSLNRSDFILSKEFVGVPSDTKSMSHYYAELLNSSICLSPEGWAPWSTKLSRIVNCGCVPLFIADGLVLPYHNSIDWKSISFKLSKYRAMGISDVLNIVDDKEIVARKLLNIFESRHEFIYYLDGRSGAICHLLNELKLKKTTLRNYAWTDIMVR